MSVRSFVNTTRSVTKVIILGIFLSIVIFGSIYSLKLYFPTHRFIITTYGGSGSTWLSKIINFLPGVRCTDYIHNLDFTSGPIKSRLRELISIDNYFKKINISKLYPLKSLGNVHGFSYAGIASEAKVTKNLTVINLIRNPIDRMESMHKTKIRREEQLKKRDKDYKLPDEGNITLMQKIYYDKIVAKFGKSIFDDYRNILFLDVIEQQDRAYKDMQMCMHDNIMQVRFEDVTTQTESLIELVTKITNHKLILSENVASGIIEVPPLNQHHKNNISAEQKYDAWPAWKKYAFSLHLQQDAKNSIYDSFGYHLSYVQ